MKDTEEEEENGEDEIENLTRAWAWKYRENRKKEWREDTRDDKQGKNTQPVEHSSEQKGGSKNMQRNQKHKVIKPKTK